MKQNQDDNFLLNNSMGKHPTDKLRKELESVTNEIEKISGFRDTPFTRKFRRQLEGEKSVILEKLRRFETTKTQKEFEHKRRLEKANRNRSSKNKRNWNFWKSVQKNYRPDLTLKEIRSMWKNHRQGLETDISDVAWRNPSP